jgi:hypothetical protein
MRKQDREQTGIARAPFAGAEAAINCQAQALA